MLGRSIVLCSLLLFALAAPASSGDFRSRWGNVEDASVQCDRALMAAQDMQAGIGKGVVAMVDGVPITGYELQQRIAWHVAIARDEDIVVKSRARAHILTELRRDVVERNLAIRENVVVSSSEIDAEIDDFLSAQGLTRHELQNSLERAGVQTNTLRNLVAAQLLHARLTHTAPERVQVAPLNCLHIS